MTIIIKVGSMSVATRDNVAKLYVATFNRAPDAAGLSYWVNSGMSIEDISQSFFDQPETQALYPNGTAPSAFVTSVYQNLFNRAPDQAGHDYWVQQLSSNTVSKQNFILAVMNGAQNTSVSQDATILENKKAVGLSFADRGLEDVALARSVMADVNALVESVQHANAIIASTDPFAFTQSWLSGKTLYLVMDETDDRILDNSISTITFNKNGTVTEKNNGQTLQGTWSVDNKNTLVVYSDGETWYLRDSGIKIAGNAHVIYSEDVYDRFSTNGWFGAEAMTTDLASAQSLVGTYIPGTNVLNDDSSEPPVDTMGGELEIMPSYLSDVTNLVALNTSSGDLSNASIKALVVEQTGIDAYNQAFDPTNYQGYSDNVFTGSELGNSSLGNLPATGETLESLFYGTIINAYQSIDMEEIFDIQNFLTSSQNDLIEGSQTAIEEYINLMVDIFSDPASPSIIPDDIMVELAVASGVMFVEMVGMNGEPALFDGALFGFIV